MPPKITLPALLGVFIITSCAEVKSTFQQEYTAKIPYPPSQSIAVSSDNASVYMTGITNPNVSITRRAELSRLDAATGKMTWSEGVNKLGDMVKEPKNTILIPELDIALVFGEAESAGIAAKAHFKVSAIDMKSQTALWNRTERSSGYSFGGMFLPQNQSFMIQTPDGLEAFDLRTGKVLWSLQGLSTKANIGTMSLRLMAAEDINFYYVKSLDRILLEVKDRVSLLNPFTGAIEWQAEDNIGSYLDADIFDEEGYAVFYGRSFSSNRNEVASSPANTDGSVLGMMAGRAVVAMAKSVQSYPVMFIDLKTGRVNWRSSFYSNGQKQVTLTPEKLLISGLVSFAFDRASGEKTWQNVSDQRLSREGLLSLLGEFTGIDYSAERHKTKPAPVVGSSIFTVYPDVFDEGGKRRLVSIRSYDFMSGTLNWKTEPSEMEIRDMYLRSGMLFVIHNGKHGRASRITAIDPYTGQQRYQIDLRDPFRNELTFTDNHIYALSVGALTIFDIRTGEKADLNRLSGFVADVQDQGDYLLVAYSGKNGTLLGFHDRNTFRVLNQIEVPFYSRDLRTVNNKQFMVRESKDFKGIIHLDLNPAKPQVFGYASVGANKNNPQIYGTTTSSLTAPYQFVLSNDGNTLYSIQKKNIVRYSIKP
jgi:hypothetical protein